MQHPVARELLADAQWQEGDVHWRKNLPYSTTTYAGDGFALVGDASAFIDPFYSPGMDWISFTTSSAARIIQMQQRGENIEPLLARHNRDFTRSYERWFTAVYQDKYEYLGEFDLMRLAFLLDLGLYYLGVASQPYKRGASAFGAPVFSLPASVPFYYLMRLYNRRFARIGRARAREINWERTMQAAFLVSGYTFEPLASCRF
jgi:hypothetical protein